MSHQTRRRERHQQQRIFRPPSLFNTAAMKSFLLLVLAILTAGGSHAFVQPRAAVACPSWRGECSHRTPSTSALRLMNDDDDNKEVNVNLIPDVDAFTLTAVGFGLIAFNFFVLANVSPTAFV